MRVALSTLVAGLLVTAAPAAAATTSVEPLTDEQWAAHVRLVEDRTAEAKRQGLSTDEQYTVDPERKRWKPERAQQHQRVADELYARGDHAPRDGKAVLTGGLPGAGKTTVLNSNPFVEPKNYLTLSSDDAKEVMCEHGMVPEIEGLAPMEGSDLIQAEAAHITQLVADRAQTERRNVIWDTTMSSVPAVDKRVEPLREANYDDVSAIFLDLPVEVSVKRIDFRHRAGYERYRNGEECEGRYVPASLVRSQADDEWGSKNRKAFEITKRDYDSWYLYDSTHLPPMLAGQG